MNSSMMWVFDILIGFMIEFQKIQSKKWMLICK